MDSCVKKCRCTAGPFVGSLYNKAQPCSNTVFFNEDECACEFLPCDYCGNFQDPSDNKCAAFAPLDATGKPIPPSQVNLVLNGEAYARGRIGSVKFGSCGIGLGNEVKTLFKRKFVDFPVATLRCPLGPNDVCPGYDLEFIYSGNACGNPGWRDRYPPDTGWKPGSFSYLNLVDTNYDQTDWENYNLIQLLTPPLGFNGFGRYSYWAPQTPLELSLKCIYPPPVPETT